MENRVSPEISVEPLLLNSKGVTCRVCGKRLSHRNKSGLCRACSRATLNRKGRGVSSGRVCARSPRRFASDDFVCNDTCMPCDGFRDDDGTIQCLIFNRRGGIDYVCVKGRLRGKNSVREQGLGMTVLEKLERSGLKDKLLRRMERSRRLNREGLS